MFAVFTGAPHVGKSTLLGKFSDFGRSVMPEIAEEVINEGIYKPWLGDAEQLAFQAEVATRQRHKEAMLNNGHSVVYLDRGLVDAIAYRMVYGRSLTDLHMGMTAAHYAVAFVFEPLEGWGKQRRALRRPGVFAGDHSGDQTRLRQLRCARDKRADDERRGAFSASSPSR